MGEIARVNLVSNKDAVLKAKEEDIEKALETIGKVAVRYAKELCPVDTGNLRNSISHEVDMSDNSVAIGTNIKYAPYVEFGIGKFAEGGDGRPTPWAYQDPKTGEWIWTHGSKPQPYLRPAIDNHLQEYKDFIKQELQSES